MANFNRRWITIPLGVVLGLYISFGRGPVDPAGNLRDSISLLLGTLFFVVWILVVVAVHELGHLVAGRSVGFRFVAGVIGPFGWRSERERIVRFRPNPLVMGGYVAMVPDDDANVEARYARFILGGPIASLLLLAAVFGVWVLSGVPISISMAADNEDARTFHVLLLIIAFGSFLMLPGTLLPYRAKAIGGLPTDMMRLISLWRKDKSAQALFAALSLNRMLLAGVPAKELPPTLLKDAERPEAEDVQQLSVLQIRWAYELNHDLQAAQRTAERLGVLTSKLSKGLPKEWADGVDLIQAYHAAYARHDADAAQERITTIQPTLPTHRLTKVMIEAAVAAIRRDPDLLDRIVVAQNLLDQTFLRTSQSLEFERLWLERMRSGWPYKGQAPSTAND